MTHYPRLASLKDEFPGSVSPYFVSYLADGQLKNGDSRRNVEYEEEATQRITFLYKLVPGVADRSFGLHVARLAQVSHTSNSIAISRLFSASSSLRNW